MLGAPSLKQFVQRSLASAGYELRRRTPDLDPSSLATISAVAPFTMTSVERLFATCEAVRYVDRFSIPGAFVECGVWAGGSAMAAARTLLEVGDRQRDIYLFDTFEGMTQPTDADVDVFGKAAAAIMRDKDKRRQPRGIWCYSPLEDVRRNMATTGYPPERCHFIKGAVEATIPDQAPERIAVLRLDTDFYESTRHELEHLVHRVVPNGVLLIDDYGHWQGARRAVDEWLGNLNRPVFIARVDYSGRVAILP